MWTIYDIDNFSTNSSNLNSKPLDRSVYEQRHEEEDRPLQQRFMQLRIRDQRP